MRGIQFVPLDPPNDPPDFLGTDRDGRNIGLELTRWLDGEQTKASIDRESFANDFLGVLKSERVATVTAFTDPRLLSSSDVTLG